MVVVEGGRGLNSIFRHRRRKDYGEEMKVCGKHDFFVLALLTLISTFPARFDNISLQIGCIYLVAEFLSVLNVSK